MHTPTTLVFALMLAASALAQDPTPPAAAPVADKQATAKLQKTLETTAALPTCAFGASWKQGDKKGGGMQVFLAFQGQANGTADGTWSGDQLHLAIGDDELRRCDGRMLAKDKTTAWTPRSGRFADGNRVGFVPDPRRLLAALLALDLAVVHREVASLDDRPVEIATATLTQDQYAELLWNDLLPEAGSGLSRMVAFGAGAGAGAPARTSAPKPEATVDVAFTFDPSTGLLQRLHVRSYHKTDMGVARAGGGVVFVAAGGGGVVRGGADQDQKDDDDDAAEPKGGEARYVDGLPERKRKGLAVLDYVLDLKQHGTATLPALDERAQKLLGR